MPIASVRHTLRIFSEWIDNGFYVFRTLPQGVKRPLPVECVSQLKRMSQESELSIHFLLFTANGNAVHDRYLCLMYTIL